VCGPAPTGIFREFTQRGPMGREGMSMQRKATGRLLLAVATGGLAAPVGAQEDVTSAFRIPADGGLSVEIDGRITEEVWERASPFGGFRQRDPDEGAAATERTEVRLAYDDQALYVAVTAYDTSPDGVVARLMQRDKLLEPDAFGNGGLQAAGDDVVAILLDPFHDHRNGFVFATNANGAEFEALITDEGGGINVDWRAVWSVAGTRTPDGWSAEFAIPWRTLRYPEGADEPWGINVMRVIRRKNEVTLWQSWEREGGGLQRVSRAGHLPDLVDLPRQGLNVEAKPYVLGARRQEVDDLGVMATSTEPSIGLDLKSEVRPGLLLDLTVNTDFAQVEVDDAQVNLTRFNLFFPEKRDFFLENSGVFDFGTAGNPLEPPAYQMFFSRQIGISEDGEVPILAGARLTGRLGGQSVGFMSVATDAVPATADVEALDRELFSVARVKRDVGESNYVGAMVVDRRGNEPANTVAGIDGQFVIGQAWVWEFFGSRSFTEGPGGDDFSYQVGYSYFGDRFGSYLNHYGVGPDARAEAGFITRTDYRRTEMYSGPTWRPSALGLREIQLFGGGQYATTVSDNRLQDWSAGFYLSTTWETSDNLSIFPNAGETVVDEPFDLSDDVSVPAGRYRTDQVRWFAGTSTARALQVGTNGVVSSFYGGSLVTVSTTVTGAFSPQLSVTPGFTRNLVDVPDGSFTADISSLRVSYSFSTKLSTNVLVQYNSLDSEFSANVRFNYIHRPGSDLFIVFTENRGGEDYVWNRLSDRGLVAKLTYLVRF
jgi:hypothetical protein